MFDKLVDKMFKKVDDVVYDLTTNSIGVKKDGSIFSIVKDENGSFLLSENILADFAQAIPAFAKSVPVSDVKVEDLILSSDGKPYGWVMKVNEKSLKVLKLNGTASTVVPSKVGLLGTGQTVMVVSSLMAQNGGAIDPMMLMMLGEDSDMLPMFMMMQQNTQDNNQMNQMLPMLMMMKNKGKGSSDEMMKFMMMQQMMNGGNMNGMNPMLLAMLMGK